MAHDTRGRRGFGHTQDRRQVVPAEADLILRAAEQVLHGTTLSSIVDEWNRRGVTTTTGGPWRINALSALLIQPRLAGGNGVPAPDDADRTDSAAPSPSTGAVPAILDVSTHQALVALRRARGKSGPRRSGKGSGSGRRYLLTGFLHCWRCDSRLGGITPRTSSVQPHYRCPSRGAGGCSGVVVHASHAEDAARDAVIARVDDPTFLRSIEDREAVMAVEEATVAALVADAVTGRDRNGNGPGGAGLWTESRRIDGDAWGRLKEVLENRLGTGAAIAGKTLLGHQREVCGQGTRLQAGWDGMELEERRSIIDAVVDHFVVGPAPRLRSRFASERLEPVWRG